MAEKIALVTTPKVLVNYEPKLNATLEIADNKLRRQAQYEVRGWLEQDRGAALKWIEAHTATEEDKAFFARMIRSMPEQRPIGPVIILE